ncbi:MAG: hypothetical protein M3441_05820 [Chloroflexota bacterium]|nr:hypothetical protein [Chloroflexota bacterium]
MRQTVLARVLMLASLVALAACDPNTAPAVPSATLVSPTHTAPPLPDIATPNAVPTPTVVWVNVTREQYDQALTKWVSQGIEEYEAQVEYHGYSAFMGIWTLRVKTVGGNYEVLDYTREPGLDAPVGDTGSQGQMPTNEVGRKHVKEQLKYLTIEGQFKDLGAIVAGRGVGCFTTEAAFDPQLGNPINVDSYPTNCSHGDNWELKSFNILKQHKPTPTPS